MYQKSVDWNYRIKINQSEILNIIINQREFSIESWFLKGQSAYSFKDSPVTEQ